MSKSAIRVRLTQPGHEKMTGYLGCHEFVDGLSVKEIEVREALRLGAILSVADEQGRAISPSTYHFPNPSAVEAPVHNLERGVDVPNARVAGNDLTDEGVKIAGQIERNVKKIVTVQIQTPANGDAALAPEVSGVPAEPATAQIRVYSAAELEEIADKDGITGLRKIGDPLALKSNSISGLINAITEAQQKLVGIQSVG